MHPRVIPESCNSEDDALVNETFPATQNSGSKQQKVPWKPVCEVSEHCHPHQSNIKLNAIHVYTFTNTSKFHTLVQSKNLLTVSYITHIHVSRPTAATYQSTVFLCHAQLQYILCKWNEFVVDDPTILEHYSWKITLNQKNKSISTYHDMIEVHMIIHISSVFQIMKSHQESSYSNGRL